MTDHPSEVGEGLCFPSVSCLVCGGVHKIEDCPKACPSADRGEGQAGPSAEALAYDLAYELAGMLALNLPHGFPREEAARRMAGTIRPKLTAALRASEAALAEMRAEYARVTELSEDDAWTLDVPPDDKACVAEYRIRWLRVKMALAERTKERDDCYTHRTEIIGRIPHLVEAARAEATKAEGEAASWKTAQDRLRAACALAVKASEAHDVLKLALHNFHQDPSLAAIRAPRPPEPEIEMPPCAHGQPCACDPLSTEHGQGSGVDAPPACACDFHTDHAFCGSSLCKCSGVDAKPSDEPPKHRAWCRESWGGTQKCECAAPSPEPPRAHVHTWGMTMCLSCSAPKPEPPRAEPRE